MGNYVEKNLGKNEKIIERGKLSYVSLISIRILGNLIALFTTEIAITNKNVIGKTGLIKTKNMSSPLNKVQNCSVKSGLMGKIFGYGTLTISTAAGQYSFSCIRGAEKFKSNLMAQIDQYEDDKIKEQAMQMANAINGKSQQ